MKSGNQSEARNVGGYLLALFAMLLALGAAVPVFAAADPAGEDGGTLQPKVVGGEPLPDGKYEFVAALRDITRGNTAYQQQFCGGTLIDRDSILTAAHCVQRVTPLQLRVTVGRTVLTSSQGQSRKVTAIFVHPKYNGVTSEAYDAAVLKLDRRVKNIAPARIPEQDDNALETPGGSATVAGWGNTKKQSPIFGQPDRYPNRMQQARVPIVPDNEGKRVYDSSYVKPLMLAAGKGGKDTCQGDSGGPIFLEKATGFFQIGITSFGIGCGARGLPSVYAEVNSEVIRSFIFRAAGK